MTVVVVVREMVVTVIRSFLEQEGHDFSAKMPGKIKMVLQCATVIASIILLATTGSDGVASLPWLPTTVTILAWAMVRFDDSLWHPLHHGSNSTAGCFVLIVLRSAKVTTHA